MKILALDTTTKVLTIGITDGNAAGEYNLEVGRKLSALLEPTIKKITDYSGCRLSSLDYFALGLGPGSFTGIRVGIACVKGLAWALTKSIVGVSTLDILAMNAKDEGRIIIPAIDAKRSLIYCSSYIIKDGQLKRNKPYMLLSERELLKFVPKGSIMLGDALSIYKESLAKIKGVKLLDKETHFPKAHNLISLAMERIKDGKVSDTFNIKPIYLYPKECQIKNI